MNDPSQNEPPESRASDESERTRDRASEPMICLDQFLKTCGVATGGQAKQLIQGGEVLVNQEIETRRRRKLRVGDEVQLFDDVFVVALEDPADQNPMD